LKLATEKVPSMKIVHHVVHRLLKTIEGGGGFGAWLVIATTIGDEAQLRRVRGSNSAVPKRDPREITPSVPIDRSPVDLAVLATSVAAALLVVLSTVSTCAEDGLVAHWNLTKDSQDSSDGGHHASIMG